jgi:hypothetical protein
MPNIADVFNSDAFGAISMTQNINNIPYQPSRCESLGIFDGDGDGAGAGITTQQLAVVNVDNILQLISDEALATFPNFQQTDPADIRYITVPHLPLMDTVLAHELPGLPAFGQVGTSMSDTDMMQSVQSAITQKQAKMVANHRLTWEWMRLGSVKGILLDSNGTDVIYNWFTEFGITQKTITWTEATAGDINRVCDEINRHTADVLGQDSATGIHCFVGSDFMTALTNSPDLQPGFLRYPASAPGELYRENYVYGQLMYRGITFEEYRGQIGGNPYVAAAEGYSFPLGTNAFIRRNAPGDLSEAVGRPGLPMYSAREVKRFGTGWDLLTSSNPIFMCQRPQVLIKITVV